MSLELIFGLLTLFLSAAIGTPVADLGSSAHSGAGIRAALVGLFDHTARKLSQPLRVFVPGSTVLPPGPDARCARVRDRFLQWWVSGSDSNSVSRRAVMTCIVKARS